MRQHLLSAALLAAGLCTPCAAQSLYAVRVGHKSGFIDSTGRLAIPAKFDSVGSFADGLARVEFGVVKKGDSFDHSNARYGFIDQKGELRIEARFDYAHDFSDGLAVVKVDRRYGYVDTAGNLVIEPRFRGRVGDFHEGRAWVELDKQTIAYIDREGEIVFRCANVDVSGPGNFASGLCRVETKDGEVRFHDRDGKIAFTPDCKFAAGFVEGRARARTDKGWGFLDRKGNWAIEPRFRYASSFSESFAVVTENGKSFYITRDGQQAFDCAGMARLSGFHEGLAMVQKKDGGKFGFVDTKGKWVIAPKWDDPMGYGYFSGGVARVADKSKGPKWRGWIDRSGNLLWPRDDN